MVKKGLEDTYGDIPHAQNFLAAIRNDKPLSLNTEIAEAHKTTPDVPPGEHRPSSGAKPDLRPQQRPHQERSGGNEVLVSGVCQGLGAQGLTPASETVT